MQAEPESSSLLATKTKDPPSPQVFYFKVAENSLCLTAESNKVAKVFKPLKVWHNKTVIFLWATAESCGQYDLSAPPHPLPTDSGNSTVGPFPLATLNTEPSKTSYPRRKRANPSYQGAEAYELLQFWWYTVIMSPHPSGLYWSMNHCFPHIKLPGISMLCPTNWFSSTQNSNRSCDFRSHAPQFSPHCFQHFMNCILKIVKCHFQITSCYCKTKEECHSERLHWQYHQPLPPTAILAFVQVLATCE